MNSRIILIIVYFGQLPLWLPAFLLSCRYNPEIDWLIVSDSDGPSESPENVRFLNMDLEAFNRLASEKLQRDLKILPSYLYKLVDVKPVLGPIFEDYVRDYDFWGHCDLDIVWGRIRHFIDQRILENFDIITSRVNKISGHFCLYRNTPEIPTIFLSIPKVTDMLETTDELFRLTEPVFTKHLHEQINPRWFTWIKQMLLAHQPVKPRIYWEKELTTCGSQQRRIGETPRQGLRWVGGRAFDVDGQETMYLHFHKIKASIQEINFGYADDPAEFVITTSKIVTL